LAAATGVTVRTLHHFDEIGLLSPTERSPTGHRLYTGADVARLHRIVALRRLGVPLSGIAAALSGAGDAVDLVRRQRDQVAAEIGVHQRLRERLDAVLRALRGGGRPTVDQLIQIVEATMDGSGFSLEEKAAFRARHGDMADWQHRGAALDGEARRLVSEGVDPADTAAQDLGRRWAELMTELAGGDRKVLSSIYARLDRKGAAPATKGAVSAETWDYVKRVLAVGYGS
jgi:DNA-binding transcriptional MerR regulator